VVEWVVLDNYWLSCGLFNVGLFLVCLPRARDRAQGYKGVWRGNGWQWLGGSSVNR
jgi:hypothetical protein